MSQKKFINSIERNTKIDGELFEFTKTKYKLAGKSINVQFEKDKTILHKKSSQTIN